MDSTTCNEGGTHAPGECIGCGGIIPAHVLNSEHYCPTCAKGYRRVQDPHALPDCAMCGDKWCPDHREHFADCECLSLLGDMFDCENVEGNLWARKP